MPKLDLTAAKRIKVAGGEVLRLKGAGFSWERPTPPSRPLIVFAGSTTNGALSNSNRTFARSTGAATANCLSSAPLTEDCYFEYALASFESCALGMYAGTSPLPEDRALGQWWGEAGLNANSAGWYADFYALYGPAPVSGRLASYEDGPAVLPVHIHGAYRHATRALWLRVHANDTTYPWFDGGDPENGDTPSVVFPGSDPVYLAGTSDGGAVTLLLPEEFSGTAPAGFASGARAPA